MELKKNKLNQAGLIFEYSKFEKFLLDSSSNLCISTINIKIGPTKVFEILCWSYL